MKITKEIFDNAMDFETYDTHVKDLFAQGKTTGNNQSQELLDITKLNLQRVKRGLKTTKIVDEIHETLGKTKAVNWLIITESWCGDGANILPVVTNMAEAKDRVTLKILLRDENSEIMDNYLTNGSRSIPVVIFMDSEFNELSTWGSRPKLAQQFFLENKANPMMDIEEVKLELQKWYLNDKGLTTQLEINDMLKSHN